LFGWPSFMTGYNVNSAAAGRGGTVYLAQGSGVFACPSSYGYAVDLPTYGNAHANPNRVYGYGLYVPRREKATFGLTWGQTRQGKHLDPNSSYDQRPSMQLHHIDRIKGAAEIAWMADSACDRASFAAANAYGRAIAQFKQDAAHSGSNDSV